MTAQPGSAPAPAQPPARRTIRIDPVPGSRLDQLMDARQAAALALAVAEERFSAADAAVKSETTLAAEGYAVIDIGGNAGRPAMRLQWTVTRRFDSRRFREDQPAVYEAYRRPSGHWEIRELTANGGW